MFKATSILSLASLLALASSTPVIQTRQQSNDKPLLQDFDSLGAWFDGVAAISSTAIPRRDNVSIAIVGAGITGLSTALMLESIGIHNWEIIEASDRVGGRFRTKFVGGTQEFAEMGPMRLPYSITYKSDNSTHEYTDHRMVWQLADWLNELNQHDPKWEVGFIPWIQHSPNELLARGTGRHPDGRIPTRAEIAANASLASKSGLSTQEYKDTKAEMDKLLKDEKTLKSIQRDVWRAHKHAMEANLDDYSEQALMRTVLGASENVTDSIWTGTDYDVFWDEMVHNSNLAQEGSDSALGETEWKCVDGGFDRLSDAFIPHVQDRLFLNRKVTKVEAIESGNTTSKNRITWQTGSGKNRTFGCKEYDYTLMAAPFTMTRFMDLPAFSSVLSRAISEAGLRFKSACKVALLFEERFWEKGERPIFGGYSQPESIAVGALYYPGYGLNETGRPGVIIHYRGGDWSDRFVSMFDQTHVDLVLDAIVSLHGEEARDLYTGDYERLCWLQDEFTATSWTRPDVEQHKLYIPAYHRTEKNIIFLGEHTAPTHAWVSSSLHESVRGSVQLLLELGMVEEAKELNQRWMGRWIGLEDESYVVSPVAGVLKN
ncbi:L-amino-acid oxidase [Fulvia fulva]|uniref:L-amino-acid oxidase n=1 Tax=Passalora fulva TaxID=5499 RepID=A0A9Q8L6B8_PASFU|nr:L-amino-acid oxidase [Fulvia fulva]KAK4635407.1 L-amino-acid oxidase [Fulvia fulva]KAK4638021.1 L-amino-acid oxidase [Fulvia fulva]UJO11628.1 L-amino-acid oxidase [Fulvia fulva]WPV09663.1 L-amino-acid oxidase [Fulvia fulva]WPV23679.1 L-amino-acid oxidase [Fulvia fulva]